MAENTSAADGAADLPEHTHTLDGELPLLTEADIHGEDDLEVRDLGAVSSTEVMVRAIVLLMSAGAEKLGLSEADPHDSPHFDLDEARRIITALAGLVTASAEWLGPRAAPVRDGLQGLQRAFREFSAYPDEPGKGPGEKYTGPLH